MCLATDKFVFIRVPKTASAWAHNVLNKESDARRAGHGGHVPLADLLAECPELLEGKISFGMIRNPWDWYVSLYLHLSAFDEDEPSVHSFRQYLHAATHSSQFEQIGEVVGLRWTMSQDLDFPRYGLCSFVHEKMLGLGSAPCVDIVIAADRAQEGLEVLIGPIRDSELQRPFNTAAKRAPLPRGAESYRDFYDEDSLLWVAEADKEFIARFEFLPFASTKQAVFPLSHAGAQGVTCLNQARHAARERQMSWWQKWMAFFRPVAGWKKRYRSFKGGNHVWSIPGKPDKPRLIPFPLAWIPHTLDESQFDEADAERGFKFLPAVCAETGKEAPVGVGVLCLRCGIPLHPEAANMGSGFAQPYCDRCAVVLRWVA